MTTNTKGIYAMKHRILSERLKSQSGGAFAAISDYILENNGIVYGCKLNHEFIAEHSRAATKLERDEFRGSKYIQSNLMNTFNQIKMDLKQNKFVLFSGTSCQVAGLKSYVKENNHLICVDIICHGVPSPKVWKDYLSWVNNKHTGNIKAANFRDKQNFGWKAHVESINIDNYEHNSTIFAELFYNHSIIRPCCFKCPYKSIDHPSDITIGDCWGIDKAIPQFNDNKGISLILINSDNGKLLFDKVKNKMEVAVCDIHKCMQEPLIRPFSEPKERNRFWIDYHKKSFDYIVLKYVLPGLYYKKILDFSRRAKAKLKKKFHTLFKNF